MALLRRVAAGRSWSALCVALFVKNGWIKLERLSGPWTAPTAVNSPSYSAIFWTKCRPFRTKLECALPVSVQVEEGRVVKRVAVPGHVVENGLAGRELGSEFPELGNGFNGNILTHKAACSKRHLWILGRTKLFLQKGAQNRHILTPPVDAALLRPLHHAAHVLEIQGQLCDFLFNLRALVNSSLPWLSELLDYLHPVYTTF